MNPLKEAKVKVEYDNIVEALKKTNFHKGKAAKLLGIDSKTIYNRLKRYRKITEIGQPESIS